MQQIKTSTPEEIFLKIADSIEKAGGALDKAKSLQDIMGRGGRQLVPAFVSGFAATAASAPDPIDSETIKKLAEFNDQLDRLKREALPAAADAVGGMADFFAMMVEGSGGENVPGGFGTRLSNAMKNAGRIFSDEVIWGFLTGGLEGAALDPSFWWGGSNMDWTEINKKFGKSLAPAKPPKTPPTPAKEIGPQFMRDGMLQGGDFTPTKPETSFTKPSLALNALQRIGAAVSQSTDPIAIEKDNNALLKRIANNTKDTARNTE